MTLGDAVAGIGNVALCVLGRAVGDSDELTGTQATRDRAAIEQTLPCRWHRSRRDPVVATLTPVALGDRLDLDHLSLERLQRFGHHAHHRHRLIGEMPRDPSR